MRTNGHVLVWNNSWISAFAAFLLDQFRLITLLENALLCLRRQKVSNPVLGELNASRCNEL